MSVASFKVSKKELSLVKKIVDRAIAEGLEDETGKESLQMDLVACHANGCPLDLEKLLAAPSPHFGHDVLGIRKFIDRTTGQLKGSFDPRCSKPAEI